MALEAHYLGMTLSVSDLDTDNLAYFAHLASGTFHLQQCGACNLLRYPPGPACVWCGHAASRWVPVSMTGTVHSYTEVHHAIQPGFRDASPYMVLLVDLDEQRALPDPHDALRVIGNLVSPDGLLAPATEVRKTGIGTRVRMVFTPLAPNFSLPNWTLGEDLDKPTAWRVSP